MSSAVVRANSGRHVGGNNTPNECTTVNVHITIAEAIIQDDVAQEAADVFMAAKLFYTNTPNGSGASDSSLR
jgi:hypothetical protein